MSACAECQDRGYVLRWSEGWAGIKTEPIFGARKPYQVPCGCQRRKP